MFHNVLSFLIQVPTERLVVGDHHYASQHPEHAGQQIGCRHDHRQDSSEGRRAFVRVSAMFVLFF